MYRREVLTSFYKIKTVKLPFSQYDKDEESLSFLLIKISASNRVRTLLSSSNSMTFHDLFKFSKTLGLAVT